MAKLVLLFVCVAIFQIANALKCYHCEKEGCEKKMEEWQTPECSKDTAQFTSICTKLVYKDATAKKDFTIRKCEVEEKGKTFECKKDLGDVVSCDTCRNADLCNSASKIGFSLTAASGILMALLIPKLVA